MDQRDLRVRLPSVELATALFNAQRTSRVPHGRIERAMTETFDYLIDATRPADTYYNRAVLLAGAMLTPATLATLPATAVALELTPAQSNADVAALLLETAFRPAYQLCYLGAVPGDVRARVTAAVERLGPNDVDRFFDLLQQQGVEFPPEKRARKRPFYCTDRFRCYVARAGAGTACAWTTMYVEGRAAFFGNSFTLPPFRRLGMHSALLAARLNDAADLGLTAAYTDVEYGSQSHSNCERAGMRTLTINTVWSRADPQER